MAKVKTAFVCQQCGYRSPKWVGQCPGCGEWNSLVETTVVSPGKSQGLGGRRVVPQKLCQIKEQRLERISSRIGEFNRVLGGGVVPGSVVLIAGEPGIGKSTLLLQVAEELKGPVLYLSGEESAEQIKLRAERLKIKAENLFLLAQTDVDLVLEEIRQYSSEGKGTHPQPLMAVVADSIQSLFTTDLSGTPGSVGQVRECAHRLHRLAKQNRLALFLIGHVTKGGVIAGPKVLEHLVDTVLYFEGERSRALRLLRCFKNRFGPTDEVGVFKMGEEGLEEVIDPAEIFLSQRLEATPGSVVVVTMEGNRLILAEIQALVVPSFLAMPRRTASGLSYQRLILLSAVLEKALKLPLGKSDVYVNVVGGLRLSEPAADLGICLAIVSSLKNQPLKPKTAVFGEVGLLGEVRPVSFSQKRKKEAKKLGFSRLVSAENTRDLKEAIKGGFAF